MLMNKILRYSFVALLAMIGLNVMADTDVTFTLNDPDAITALGIELPASGKGTKVESLSKDGVNIAVTTAEGKTDSRIFQGSGNNTGKYDFRIYQNGTMTFTAGNNSIKKIVFTGNNLDKLSASGYNNGEWTGSAESVLLTATGTATIYTITVTYGTAAAVNVPEFSVLSGTYLEAQTVAMTCSTKDARILYTVAVGNDPEYKDDQNYTGVFYNGIPLNVTKSTIIKAMAVKDGQTSSIVTATYTIIPTTGKGTQENPFSVADALLYIDNMENGATTADKFYVKGFVVGTPAIDKKKDTDGNPTDEFYGNAKFYLGDTKGAETTIYAYQLKGLENANIDKADYIKEGDQVVTFSKLQKYVKNDVVTPELSSGYIYSITAAESEDQGQSWDFTQWSAETVANLKADAAASSATGWSDIEKADATEPTDISKDNCFWFAGTVNEDGSLSANGAVIKELKGLKFDSDYAAKRSLAIAVNYGTIDTSKDFGPYHGPSYLWLGGKVKKCFTIPDVAAGSKITIEAESHKISDARGIQLKQGDTQIGNDFTPTTFTSQEFTVTNAGDVEVWNTNGCHIYTIKVEAGSTGISTVKAQKTQNNVIYNLAGQKVDNSYKGVVIVNGKKMLQK